MITIKSNKKFSEIIWKEKKKTKSGIQIGDRADLEGVGNEKKISGGVIAVLHSLFKLRAREKLQEEEDGPAKTTPFDFPF